MTAVWVTVAAVGGATVLFKALGPAILGSRPLPARVRGVVELMAPALLAALVVTQTFGTGHHLTVDARAAGVGAAAVAIALRVPLILVVVIAAAVTALTRAVG